MEIVRDMEFEIKSSFIPNISNSQTLKVLEVTDASVVVLMDHSGSRGVFPLDHFQYWIRKNSLIPIDEHQEKSS
ncbi:hypothetical protein R4Z10_11455 [Niallia sp. XMNu-256]|uniref:hypothetical protein n=1 Tax=Niallia sp. XMNu-256 TaxID=3082444 RepID=UPI0030D34D9C